MSQCSYTPHGGCGLTDLFVADTEKESFLNELKNAKVYQINDADLSVFYRMADGVLSPLQGPMDSDEFNQVLEDEVIIRNGNKYAYCNVDTDDDSD